MLNRGDKILSVCNISSKCGSFFMYALFHTTSSTQYIISLSHAVHRVMVMSCRVISIRDQDI